MSSPSRTRSSIVLVVTLSMILSTVVPIAAAGDHTSAMPTPQTYTGPSVAAEAAVEAARAGTTDAGVVATGTAATLQEDDEETNATLMSMETPPPETSVGVASPAGKRHRTAIPFHSGTVRLDPGLDPAVLDTDRATVYVVVQFAERPSSALLDRFDYERLDVLTYNTHFAALPRAQVRSFAERPEVRSVAAIRPEWKIEPALVDALDRRGNDPIPVTVGTFAPLDEGSLPADVELRPAYGDVYTTTLFPNDVRTLANVPTIRWLEVTTTPELGVAQGVDLVNARRVHARGYTGDGVRVAVVDTGIAHAHPYFQGVTILDNYDDRDDDYYPEADNWAWSGNDHGTHVAGTIAGRGTTSGVELVGVAPDATLVIARGLNVDQFDRVIENDSDVISNSWGAAAVNGNYRTRSRYTDEWVRTHDSTLVVACYGNWNSSNPNQQFVWEPAMAKNAVAVGAIVDGSDGLDADASWVGALNQISSLNNRTGPADGRTKPDVSAPGRSITAPSTNGTYVAKSGCSMGTPHVSGVAALVEGAYGDLSANQHKALLVATTTPVRNPNGFAQGHGNVDALNAIYQNEYEDLQQFYSGSIGEGETDTHTFTVPSGAEELVVSLSWLDPKASNNAQDTLVNDLDLFVGPKDDPYRYGLADTNENLLKQTIADPQAGEWVVKVNGWEVDGDDQRYDGVIRVVTEEPTWVVTTFDNLQYSSHRPNVTVPVALQGTGAPVSGVGALVSPGPGLSNCGPDAVVAGTLSIRTAVSADLCFEPNAVAHGDQFTVTITAATTNGAPAMQTRTVTIEAIETTPPADFQVDLLNHTRSGGGIDYYTDQTTLTFEWQTPADEGLNPTGISAYEYVIHEVPSDPPRSSYTRALEGASSIDRGGDDRGVTIFGLDEGLHAFRVIALDLFDNERLVVTTVCIDRPGGVSDPCQPPPSEEDRRDVDIAIGGRFDFDMRELPREVNFDPDQFRCRGYRLCDNPGFQWILGDERLLVTVEPEDGGAPTTFLMDVENGGVTRFEYVSNSEEVRPTYRIYVSDRTVREIVVADEPSAELVSAYERGEITVEGATLGNSIKLFGANLVMTGYRIVVEFVDGLFGVFPGLSVPAVADVRR